MNKFQLSDVAEIINGGAWSDKEYVDNGIPVARVTNFHDYSIDLSEAKYLPETSLARYEKHLLRNHDLVVSTVGSYPTQPNSVVGKPAIVSTSVAGALLNQNAVIIRSKDSSVLDQRFLAFYGLTRNFRGYIESRARGAANQVRMSIALLKELELTLPPIEVQRQVSNILIDLSDALDNNTRRIAIFEEMARRIYEEWFVHFRFPGHEQVKMVESELGLIPDGWIVAKVEFALDRYAAGKRYEQKTVEKKGLVPVLDQGKSGIIGFHNDSPGVIASLTDPVIVFANHTCYQRLMFEPFSTIQNVIPFKPSKLFPRDIYWLHFATNGIVKLNDYKGHWPQFAASNIVIPSIEVAKSFGEFIAPMQHQIFYLNRKNTNLRKTRDLLLPKLISGELGVSSMPELETEAA